MTIKPGKKPQFLNIMLSFPDLQIVSVLSLQILPPFSATLLSQKVLNLFTNRDAYTVSECVLKGDIGSIAPDMKNQTMFYRQRAAGPWLNLHPSLRKCELS